MVGSFWLAVEKITRTQNQPVLVAVYNMRCVLQRNIKQQKRRLIFSNPLNEYI